MPNVSSFPDFMADWDRLLKSVRNNLASLPDLSGLLGPLDALLDEGRELRPPRRRPGLSSARGPSAPAP